MRRAVPGDGITDDYLYDLSGHFITQVSSSGFWVRGEIYAGGSHIATYENDLTTPTTFFTHADHLGTERVETAVNGTSCETTTSLPFGDGLNTSGSCDPTSLRFTGKQRDFETNLDNFGARYYSNQLGRFMIPDWEATAIAVPYAAFGNPQTLNLYAYVGNNPVTETDATGHAGDSPPATDPIYGAEPLDVTGVDNAHWEPQADVDPVLLNNHGGESALNNELDSLDSLANAAVGDTQAHVQVTITVIVKPAIVQGEVESDGESLTGVRAILQETITVNGKAVSGTTVEEKNVNTATLNGKEEQLGTKQGSATTNKAGQITDLVGLLAPARTAAQDRPLIQLLKSQAVMFVNKNTITFTIPGGGKYSSTTIRTLTNIGPNGTVSSTYTLSKSQSVIRAVH